MSAADPTAISRRPSILTSENERLTKDVEKMNAIYKDLDEKISSVTEQNKELSEGNQILKKDKEEVNTTIVNLNDRIANLQSEITELSRKNAELTEKNTQLVKESKILNYMVNDKQNLIEEIRRDFKRREDELMSKICELEDKGNRPVSNGSTGSNCENQLGSLPEDLPDMNDKHVMKKNARVSKRAPVQEDDYANMTFTGDDEIVQVSAKKTRSKITAASKQRQDLTLSGKKRKLTNYGADIDLSPISPPVRITRSRNTRRKLAY